MIRSEEMRKDRGRSTENTQGALAERRMRALRDLVRLSRDAHSIEECLQLAAKTLASGDLELPFVLFYMLDEERRAARLSAHVGQAPHGLPLPEEIDLAAQGARPLVDALAAGHPVPMEEESTSYAYVLPIDARPPSAAALVVVGIGQSSSANGAFTAFCELLGVCLTHAVRSGLAADADRLQTGASAELRKELAHELAVANKELESFSYSVSHDLRAPLRAIDGFSKVLLSDYAAALDDRGRHYLERVRSATQRMGQLIDDLLSLSKITRAPLVRERLDLTAIARKVLGELGAREPERNVESSVSEGLTAWGDPRLITVMFENLLGNAWKFTAKQAAPRVEVGCEQREGQALFSVRDNGAGFKMEHADKLFAPFQRLHSAAEFPGTGIGLATVHRVIVRHGGRIWAEAQPDEGATFWFTLGEQL